MGMLNTIEKWRTKFFLWVGLPLIAAMGLLFGTQDLIPAWQAKSGTGTVGTFTATGEDCGRRSCTMKGDWRATEGTASRAQVILYDDPDSMAVGDTAEAIDSGARKGVFATAGGSTYLLVTGLTLAGVAAAIGWIFFLWRTFGRRRNAPTESQKEFFAPR